MGAQRGAGRWRGDRSDPGSFGAAPLSGLSCSGHVDTGLPWSSALDSNLGVELARKMGMRGNNTEKGQTKEPFPYLSDSLKSWRKSVERKESILPLLGCSHVPGVFLEVVFILQHPGSSHVAAVAFPCAAGIPRVNPVPGTPPSAPARNPGQFTPTKLRTNIYLPGKKVNWKMSSELALPAQPRGCCFHREIQGRLSRDFYPWISVRFIPRHSLTFQDLGVANIVEGYWDRARKC